MLDYVGRYTHRVAIANHRLVALDHGQVRFRYKDYRDPDGQKTMTLDASAFIRRFLLHVLPSGFHRIRYYGFLGNRHRAATLARCRHLLDMPLASTPVTVPDHRDRFEVLTGRSLRICPNCHIGHMLPMAVDTDTSMSPAVVNTS